MIQSKNTILLLLAILCFYNCSNSIKKKEKSYELKDLYAKDLDIFSYISLLKNNTIYFISNTDTVRIINLDSLGRISSNIRKSSYKKEGFSYLLSTNIPAYKRIIMDYYLSKSSYSYLKDSTLYQIWFDELNFIEDTFNYKYENYIISEMYGMNIDDLENCKYSKKIIYQSDKLVKVITKPRTECKLTPFYSDSIIRELKYDENNFLSNVIENVFFKDKRNNFKNYLYFDKDGLPIKYI